MYCTGLVIALTPSAVMSTWLGRTVSPAFALVTVSVSPLMSVSFVRTVPVTSGDTELGGTASSAATKSSTASGAVLPPVMVMVSVVLATKPAGSVTV